LHPLPDEGNGGLDNFDSLIMTPHGAQKRCIVQARSGRIFCILISLFYSECLFCESQRGVQLATGTKVATQVPKGGSTQ
jgi:hypothetical protein